MNKSGFSSVRRSAGGVGRRRTLHAECLEARLLLSADLLGGLDSGSFEGERDTGEWSIANDPARSDLPALTALLTAREDTSSAARVQPAALDLDALTELLADVSTAGDGEMPVRTELVVLDTTVADADQLIEALRSDASVGYVVVLVGADDNGIARIGAALADVGTVSAIHVLGHGDTTGFVLGDRWLDIDSLNSVAGELAQWAQHLTPDADFLLYGCELASNDSGRALIDALAVLTGADVGASDDLTGSTLFGGDWVLEYTNGTIEAALAFEGETLLAWQHVLAPPLVAPAITDVMPTINAVDDAPLLRFSTKDAVTGATGAPGSITDWGDDELVEFNDPSLSLGADTGGTIGIAAFDLKQFVIAGRAVNIDAMHVVQTGVTIGDGSGVTFDVQPGDLLLSINKTASLQGTSGEPIVVEKGDVFVFRPEQPDFSEARGQFLSLLTDVNGNGRDITAISLVEADTQLTSTRTVSTGDFLFVPDSNDIQLFEPGDLAADDIGIRTILIDAGDNDINARRITGLELVEQSTMIGGISLAEGDLLLSQNGEGRVAELEVTRDDIFVLTLATNSNEPSSITPSASMFFDGSDIGLNSQDIDAVSLGNQLFSPVLTATGMTATVAYTEDNASIALPDIVLDAPDGVDAVITATLTLQDTAAGSFSTPGASTFDGLSGSWSVTGAIVDVNSALAAVEFLPATDYDLDTGIVTHVEADMLRVPADGLFTLDVTAVNDAPVAVDSAVKVDEDVRYTFAAADFRFTDVEGDSLASITISSLETAGDLRFDGTAVTAPLTIAAADIGRLTYQGAQNAHGSAYASFEFTVNDGAAASDAAATMTIDVTAVNDAPVAVDSAVKVDEDVRYTFAAADFRFTDVEGDSLASITISSLETAGDLRFDGTAVTAPLTIAAADIGRLTYQGAQNAHGSAYASFEFTVNDGAAASDAAATMTIDVTAVNDAPVAVDSAVKVDEDVRYTFAAADFRFTDVEGDSLASITISSLETAGDLRFDGTAVTAPLTIAAADIGRLTYQGAQNAHGSAYASFEFTVNDGAAASDAAATMTIDVTAVNDAPVAVDSAVKVDEDVRYTFAAADFRFTDVEGDSLASITISSLETAGDLRFDGTAVTAPLTIAAADIGRLTYQGAQNAHGSAYASFEFTVNDGAAASDAAATMTIDVTAVNDAPVALHAIIDVDSTEDAVPANVDVIFEDVDDALLELTVVAVEGDELIADVVIDDEGRMTLTQAPDAFGAATVTVRASDAGGATADASIRFVVLPVDDAPVGSADALAAEEDAPLVIEAAAGVLANDRDADPGDVLRVASISNGVSTVAAGEALSGSNGGTFTVTPDGGLFFEPGDDFQSLATRESRTTAVDYVLVDGSGASVTVPLSVTVVGVNDPVFSLDDANSTTGDQVLTLAGNAGLLGNDFDLDTSDVLRVVSVSNGVASFDAGVVITGSAGGLFTIAPDGSYLFDPADLTSLASGVQQMTAVTYTVADDQGSTSTAMLSITVVGTANPLIDVPAPYDPFGGNQDVSGANDAIDAQATLTSRSEDGTSSSEPSESTQEQEAAAVDGAADARPGVVLLEAALAAIEEADTASRVFSGFLAGGYDPEDAARALSSVTVPAGIETQGALGISTFDLSGNFGGGRDALGLSSLSAPLFIVSNPGYGDALDEVRSRLMEAKEEAEPFVVGSLSLSAGFSIGYVSWLLRSGVIASSILSMVPMWRLIDPLPILATMGNRDEDDESIEDIVRSGESAEAEPDGGDED